MHDQEHDPKLDRALAVLQLADYDPMNPCEVSDELLSEAQVTSPGANRPIKLLRTLDTGP